MQVIAEGSFPQLRRIDNVKELCEGNCIATNTCVLKTFLPKILISKGKKLAFIYIQNVCYESMQVVWNALKYCRAAKRVRFAQLDVGSPLTITYEDVEAVCHLPNLKDFKFQVRQEEEEHDACGELRGLMQRTVKKHTAFNFEYKYKFKDIYWPEQEYSLYRIKF